MNFQGLVFGAVAFLCIGMFHPLVIKGEYYFGLRIWWAFLGLGIIFCVLSILSPDLIVSSICGIIAFSSFWGIGEVIKQEERVRKGWFPANPKRKKKS